MTGNEHNIVKYTAMWYTIQASIMEMVSFYKTGEFHFEEFARGAAEMLVTLGAALGIQQATKKDGDA